MTAIIPKPRIYISASKDQYLNAEQRQLKDAIFREIEGNGLEPWGFFKKGPLQKGWGFKEAVGAMASCQGAIVLAFAQWECVGLGPRNERGLMASEGNHFEGALALAQHLPLLVLREEGILERGILSEGPNHTRIDMPRGSVASWLSGNEEFQHHFRLWVAEVNSNMATRTEFSRRIFIVHGRDSELKNELARLLEKLDFIPVILHEQPDRGQTIIEKLGREIVDVGFAFVLLTPDDVGGIATDLPALQPRARQNVVFEHGLFAGCFSHSRVCAIRRGDVEPPSDLDGVVYKTVPVGGSIRSIAIEIAHELKAAGYDVDANRLVSLQ